MRIELDKNGAPVWLADLPKTAKPPVVPQDRHVVTILQASQILGVGPDRAAELLTLHSVGRVVGWSRAEVDALAAAMKADNASSN